MRFFLVFFIAIYEGNEFSGNQAFSHETFPCMTEINDEIEEQYGFSDCCITNIIELNFTDYYSWTGGHD